jgi:hypothetical protein
MSWWTELRSETVSPRVGLILGTVAASCLLRMAARHHADIPLARFGGTLIFFVWAFLFVRWTRRNAKSEQPDYRAAFSVLCGVIVLLGVCPGLYSEAASLRVWGVISSFLSSPENAWILAIWVVAVPWLLASGARDLSGNPSLEET